MIGPQPTAADADKEEEFIEVAAARCLPALKLGKKKNTNRRQKRQKAPEHVMDAFVCVEVFRVCGAAPSPRHVRGGFPVQRVGEAELGNDFELVLGLSGEPRRLLELEEHGAV